MGWKAWIIFCVGTVVLFLAVGPKLGFLVVVAFWWAIVYGFASPLDEPAPQTAAVPEKPRIDPKAGLAAFTDVPELTQVFPLIWPAAARADEPEESDERWTLVADGVASDAPHGEPDPDLAVFGPGASVHVDEPGHDGLAYVVRDMSDADEPAYGVAPLAGLSNIRVEPVAGQAAIERLRRAGAPFHASREEAEAAAEKLLVDVRIARGVPGPEARWRAKAEAGDGHAQFLLGLAHQSGEDAGRGGVEVDAAKAIDLVRRAADQGFPHAQWFLGVMLARGEGAPKDLAGAAALYRLAAGQDHPRAAFGLARALHLGEGVAANVDEAERWYFRAAAGDDAPTIEAAIPVLESWGYGAGEARWLPRAEAGDAEAQFRLGWVYDSGRGAPRDAGEAARWYAMASALEHAGAQNNLACLYDAGRGVEKDRARAAGLFRIAAERGNPHARRNLGDCLLHGHGVDRNPEEAAIWLRRASAAGHAIATVELARLYETGEGVVQNEDEALTLMGRAAWLGHPVALVRIGQLYERGEGGRYDPATARLYYRRAAASGDPEALKLLKSVRIDY